MPDVQMNFVHLTDVAHVPNVGAVLQSLRIQCTKLGVASPIQKRRDSHEDGRYVYWMSALTAARVREILESRPVQSSKSSPQASPATTD
jgi:hypothetical protein